MNRTILRLDCGAGYMNLHMREIKLHRITHIPTHTHTGVRVKLVKSE